jgi:hypothetical protein
MFRLAIDAANCVCRSLGCFFQEIAFIARGLYLIQQISNVALNTDLPLSGVQEGMLCHQPLHSLTCSQRCLAPAQVASSLCVQPRNAQQPSLALLVAMELQEAIRSVRPRAALAIVGAQGCVTPAQERANAMLALQAPSAHLCSLPDLGFALWHSCSDCVFVLCVPLAVSRKYWRCSARCSCRRPFYFQMRGMGCLEN